MDFLLVHGAYHGPWCWSLLQPELIARGHTITVVDLPVMGLTPWATLSVMIAAMLVWTDLTIRRRHDRGRSGVDAVIFQILLLASVIIHSFANAPDIVGWLDALLVLYGLYLFVVLVLLPGNPAENRYGDVPRPD